MKLPEPVAWRVKDDEASDHYGKSIHAYYDSADIRLDHPNAEKLTALLESLFTEAQLRELLSKQEALMLQALEVIELHPYPGWDHVWETKQALKRALNLKE